MKGKERSQDLFRRPWDQTGGKPLKLTGASKEETPEETERKKGQNQSKQAQKHPAEKNQPQPTIWTSN